MPQMGMGLRSKLTFLSIGLVVLTATGIAAFVVHREITIRYQDLVDTGRTTAAMIANVILSSLCIRNPIPPSCDGTE